MKLAYRQLKKLIPALNETVLSAEDFYFLTEVKEAEVYELPLEKNGYYIINRKKDYIYLNSRIHGMVWLESAYHELIHLFLHVPVIFLKAKQQLEAEVFATVALIPISILSKYVREYAFLDAFTYELLKKRIKILDRWGI